MGTTIYERLDQLDDDFFEVLGQMVEKMKKDPVAQVSMKKKMEEVAEIINDLDEKRRMIPEDWQKRVTI